MQLIHIFIGLRGSFFTVEFFRLFQIHLHKNVAKHFSVGILVLFAFHGCYVGLWRLEFLVEFGGY